MESQPQNPEFRNTPENFHPSDILNVNLPFFSQNIAANYRMMLKSEFLKPLYFSNRCIYHGLQSN